MSETENGEQKRQEGLIYPREDWVSEKGEPEERTDAQKAERIHKQGNGYPKKDNGRTESRTGI